MEGHKYNAADITVLTGDQSIRRRPGMYFGIGPDRPEFPSRVLRAAVEDALHLEGGEHRDVHLEIRSGLDFVVTFEQGRLCREPMDVLFDRPRWWGLRSVAAVSERVLIEVQEGRRGARQELRPGTSPSPVTSFTASDETKTSIFVYLDPEYCGRGAALTPPDASELHGEWCVGAASAGVVTVTDLRHRAPS
ncbi:hypothetical protein GCM10009850_040350 [Nonomuraea monospora]|uniref:Uncharacterized protein n=1 Tax=Nonomuraea monospora TaxID=568818 RepID=A0ABN3CHU6_9ACTN